MQLACLNYDNLIYRRTLAQIIFFTLINHLLNAQQSTASQLHNRKNIAKN